LTFLLRCNIHSHQAITVEEMSQMADQFSKTSGEFQKIGKDGFDAAARSFGEVNQGVQAITAEVTDYSRKAFEESTRAFQQLIGAKSIEQAIEIQSQYAKKTFDAYLAQMYKLGEMYVGLTKDAYKPVEAVAAKLSKDRA